MLAFHVRYDAASIVSIGLNVSLAMATNPDVTNARHAL